jgi:pyruvate kinase
MRTHIVATIGPQSESYDVLRDMGKNGMSIARMNFSHCTYEEYRARRDKIHIINKKEKTKIRIMQDLQGPRLRVGDLPKRGIVLEDGANVLFTTERTKSKGIIYIDDPYVHGDINVGEPIYLTNGAMELIITNVSGTKISARVIRGGVLFSHKAINLPQTKLTTSGLTEKDIKDVEFAIQEGVDYIALSFVQSAHDVARLRALVGTQTKIVSKIERALALRNIDEIIQASDSIMVARGDLGAELPIEDVPFIQKNIIRHAYWHNKGTITATQMMLSMVSHPQPTRAEVSDVANAILDGSDAVMLSDETASGAYPVQAVATMANIIRKTEAYSYGRKNHL